MVSYRTGDVWSPHIEPGEALQAAVTHFAECIRDGEDADQRRPARAARRPLLEAATRSIRAQGGRVVLGSGNAFVPRGGVLPGATGRDLIGQR